MTRLGGASVALALQHEGITHTFGIPGTHNIELYDALSDSDAVTPVLVTDEQSASFMADGYWRASGRMACVNIVPGAGLTHAMSGIAEAYLDNVPMLVLGCGIRRDSGRAYQLHDVDQIALARPITKAQFLCESGEALYATIREACRVARSGVPGPVFVEVPAEQYLLKHPVGSEERAPDAGRFAPDSAPAPKPELVLRAAEILRSARRPLLYLGAGAAGAGTGLVTLAERLEAPVSTTFQGKGVFPESHSLFLWPGFGAAAPPFVRDIAEQCDVTLAIGCRFSEVGTASYGLVPPGPLIHADIDPEVFSRNFRAEVAVHSDARLFVDALLDELGEVGPSPDEALRSMIGLGHEDVWEEWLLKIGGERVTPAHLIRSLQLRLGPDVVFTTDSGNGTFLAMECLRLDRHGCFLAPVDYSCMGYAVPAALGAAIAEPGRPVVSLAGDGAFLMTGLEMLTAAREGLGVMVFVLRDRELAQIAQIQAAAFNRKVISQVPDYEVESLARGMGVAVLHLDTDDQVEDVIREARSHTEEGRPVLIDTAIDYSEKTYFTQGVVKSNLLRLPLRDRIRFIGRAMVRKLTE